VTAEARRGLKQVWGDSGVREGRGFLALSPGATFGPAKRWPLSYWKELVARLLVERKESLLLLGGLEEEAYLRPLMDVEGGEGRLHLLAGRTSPEILVAMLSRCKVLITNDTGPMHAAAAAGTPTVALFGSTSPDWTRPFGKGHEVIHKRIECSPCFQRTCPIGYKCLHAIKVEEVLSSVRRVLRAGRRAGPESSPFPLGAGEEN
jgi:heptosyltransferase-2